MKYGYARVSTKNQNEARQIVALKEYDIEEKNIFVDKQSGKDFERRQYKRMIKKIRKGDTLVIKSIDRLGRNYNDILEQWRIITKEKGTNIVVLDMPLLNEDNLNGLTGTLIADIVLQIFSYVAETERQFIRQRQEEGIAIAKLNGVKFGRTPKERPCNYDEVKNKWKNKEISAREAARLLDITHPTFIRWVKEDTFGKKSTVY